MSWLSPALKPIGLIWFDHFLTSSLGKKVIMSLTGLFLILFLMVHLMGNLQLLNADGGESFNKYTYFMTHNPLIKTVSYLLYLFILLHAIQGWRLWAQNHHARGGQGYAVQVVRAVGTNGRVAARMGWLGTIIFVFLVLHMWQFWFQMKTGNVTMVLIGEVEHKDLYTPVVAAFSNLFYVIVYVFSMWIIAVHLWHGFQSAFQTLGLNHKKYTPLIRFLGKLYSVLVPLGFALIPLLVYGQVQGWWSVNLSLTH
ncbi:MAG: succinate dehydrogenase cytochrome b subunit [Haliscomenobacter sp.]|nr:succinate dehydrogenase cytochrome b subunit [Haliscomenobacter sp.]MBK8653926.1 succinate dehydrogenase cytochrome b subunit [Haliscomenobacter sp.]